MRATFSLPHNVPGLMTSFNKKGCYFTEKEFALSILSWNSHSGLFFEASEEFMSLGYGLILFYSCYFFGDTTCYYKLF
jgi:hypothetical protein